LLQLTWQKGQSGNPIGPVNAKEAALKRRLHGLTFKAVDALERVLNDDDATHGERLAAAREVFDRAIGKPKQSATLDVQHNLSPHLNALVTMAALTAARVHGAPEIDGQVIEIIEPVTIVDQSERADADAELPNE
jgi:hypothetical protein